MQFWHSDAFKRQDSLVEFARRCFLYTMRGPVGMMDTARGRMQGFQPDAPHRMLYVDPVLPPWLGSLTVRDLRIGEQVFDIRFWRSDEETQFDVLKGDPASVAYREVVLWSDLLKRRARQTPA